MNLPVELLSGMDELVLEPNDRARWRCRLAKALEEAGDYEGASEALGVLWRGVGERPAVEGLQGSVAALVLLRAGALTGWIGRARQVQGAQETAKDFISEALRVFDESGDAIRSAEGAADLALCYWREGAFDEARVHLRQALVRLPTITDVTEVTDVTEAAKVAGKGGGAEDSGGVQSKRDAASATAKAADEVRAVLLRSAIVEITSNRLEEALRLLREAAPLVVSNPSHVLKGKYHVHLAMTLENLGTAENMGAPERRSDLMDQALVEYTAAGFHFEQARHTRYAASVENNLGMLFLALERYEEAHEHLDSATRLFEGLKDRGSIAQVSETKARVLLGEGKNEEAEAAAGRAVLLLAEGGEQALLAEALTTQGTALARSDRIVEAKEVLAHAVEVAERAGDTEGAGRASLTMLEELGSQMNPSERLVTYTDADRLLSKSTHGETLERLRKSARRIIVEMVGSGQDVMLLSGQQVNQQRETADRGMDEGLEVTLEKALRGGTLAEEVRRYEGELISQALSRSGGSVTRAARLLGLTHQSLSFILHNRHQSLSVKLKPRKKRQQRIVRRDEEVGANKK